VSQPAGSGAMAAGRPSGPPPTSSPERFETFYLREFRGVVAVAFALSGSRVAAEDIAQEAFIAAHQRWETVGRYDSPIGWVRRVAANLAARTIRRRLLEAKALARTMLGHRGAVGLLPDDAAEVWRAVRRLPRRQAQVVVLFYLAGMPVAEIAATLGCAEGTVKAHLAKARQALARHLAVTPEEAP